jgi:hypothetical protein
VTANITFMDRFEKIAFNALPAVCHATLISTLSNQNFMLSTYKDSVRQALWPDASANVYHHANNQIETGAGGPYAYDLYFCCTANVHQGWPKFVFSAVEASTRRSPKTTLNNSPLRFLYESPEPGRI